MGKGLQMFFKPFCKISCWLSNVLLITVHPVTFMSICHRLGNWVQNWWVGSCVAIKTIRFVWRGHWQKHRWAGVTLLHMHKIFQWCYCQCAYVKGWEYIRVSTHKFEAIVWLFGCCTFKLPCEKPLTLCCSYFSASHGVRVHSYRKVLFICSVACAQGYLGHP